MTHSAAVLFARKNSIYKQFPELDVFDIKRDARTWQGGLPVIAHPPCRAWGKLRHMANPRHDEKQLAILSVDLVRKFGGVLEHPSTSTLWPEKGLPSPGNIDQFGGFTLPISQNWFGHKAQKNTFLYIVGVSPSDIPPMPFELGTGTHTIGKPRLSRRAANCKPEVTKAEREHTPIDLALWLVDLAKRVKI
jgi:hypothetical protein